MMFRVNQVVELEELSKLWPRIFKLAVADCFHLNGELFLQLVLRCFGHGAVFVVRGDTGIVGCCLVEHDGSNLILHSVPNDKGTGRAKACIDAIRTYAQTKGFRSVTATTSKLSGSSYHYFEKTLGFRRHSVTFKLKIKE